jgi:hypothetical protein
MEYLSESPFSYKLEGICSFVFKRKFEKAEIATLRLLCSLLESSDDASHRQCIVSLLYHSFNSYYEAWLRKKGHEYQKELDDLRSLEHDNLLIAYCSNVYAMEMLLKQAFDYFRKPMPQHEILYYVENYKMVYLM